MPENDKQTDFKDKFDDIIDLNATSDYEEELTDDSDYGKFREYTLFSVPYF